ncbi:LamG-like jellyroll fold domain-containing protein [Stackebrandtia soli]|uniref:LamG-like jellyroll fold domain-containing protein n=1 Tax=Stackebrandtia soli TaxID=1892856 RepID=UPI0039E8EDEB
MPTGPGDGAKIAPVAIEVEPEAVALIPDEALLSDPEVTFPIHIDPDYAADPSRWVYANNSNSNYGAVPVEAAARVGRDPGNGWLYRSLFTFPVSTLKGKVITSAKFQVDLWHSWSCQSDEQPVYLYRSTYPDSTTRVAWSKATLGVYIGVTTVASNKDDCRTPDEPPAVWHNADLKSNVQSAANNYKTITFALSARSKDGTGEATEARWKKFLQDTAKLVVTYNSVPGTPTSMMVGGTACSVDGQVVVNDTTPDLTAKLPDADGTDMLTGNVEHRPIGGTATALTDTNVQAGQRASVTTATLVDGGAYEWRLRGTDQHGAYSPWTTWCGFTVDASVPAAPTITSSDFAPCGDDVCAPMGGPGEAGSFTVTAADPDVVTYRYGWSAPPIETVSTTSGDPRVIEVAPPKYGENTLFVETVDAGGNHSSTASFTFLVGSASAPSNGWELEKRPGKEAAALTNRDVAGPALTPTGSVGWQPDARLIDVDSGTFTGGGYETGQSLVRTDDSFSVSAWVRMDGPTDHGTIVAQAAANRPSFYLKYNTTKKRWGFEMPSADVASPTWHQAFSVEEPRYGVWTHLTGVLDRTEGVMRLYVNGLLESEIPAPTSWHVDGELAVGYASDNAGTTWSPFDGAMGQVRVFDRVVVGDDFTIGPDDLGPILKPELVGNWSFDEDWGTVAEDQTAWNRDLTLFGGAEINIGRSVGSSGLEVDGSTGYAATDGPVFRTDDSFSVSAWARMDGKTLDFTVVASEAVHRPSTYLKYKPSTDRWRVTVPDADVVSPGWFIAEDTVSPDVGEWYHLAAVYDAASDELRLYVNGELRAVSPGPTEPWHVDGRLLLGAAASQAGTEPWSFADGGIDDVAVYQSALTDSQVDLLSNGILP